MSEQRNILRYGDKGKEISKDDLKSLVGPGWGPILDSLCDDLFSLGWDGYVAQVKEKFGGLRFYLGGIDTEATPAQLRCWYKCIDKAEKESYTVCEDCGAPGKPAGTPWIRTLCEEHTKELMKFYEPNS